MNERIKEIAREAMMVIVSEAFRAGLMYASKKYEEVKDDRFTGNDVSMFLEMEACELSDDDIQKHFGIE